MPEIIFFDLDNTLWDGRMEIPDSACEAIRKLHEAGHITMVCTGRARSNLRQPKLFELPFDGILAACGNYVEYHGEILKDNLLTDDVARHSIEVMRKYHMPIVAEGPKYHWIDDYGFDGDGYVDYLRKALGDSCKTLTDYEQDMQINKFSTLILPETNWSAIKEQLNGELEMLEHPYRVVELIPLGTSKATGIHWICDYLHIGMEHAYALGDSTNDLEMIAAVAHGICMGNGQDSVKALAEYVTDDIDRDGVYKAMVHYGLIRDEEDTDGRTILCGNLEAKLNIAVDLVIPMLEEQIPEQEYVQAVEAVVAALQEASQEEISNLDLEDAVKTSLGADKNLLVRYPRPVDQVSLLSTLVIYVECRREGMPNHARKYMDRVTAIRHHLDHYYQEKVEKICGS